MLNISGVFSAQLQDNRRYKRQSCGLRLLFADGSGKVKQARLACKMTYRPYESTPLEISGAANRAFRDERPGDGKGGWSDQGPRQDLRMIPLGNRRFGGVNFRIVDPEKNGGNSCIGMKGRERPDFLNEATVAIPGYRGRFLYLLNALAWGKSGGPCGEVILRYQNGMEQTVYVTVLTNLAVQEQGIRGAAVLLAAGSIRNVIVKAAMNGRAQVVL